METTTVEDLPFDPRPEDLEPGPYADLLDDAEPNDRAEAVFAEASEIAGLHVRLLIGITEYAYQHAGDKGALDALKTVFKWNPKHLVRAYRRSPGLFNYENADSLSWEDIVAAWTLGKVNDDLRAAEIEDEWRANTLTLAELRDAVKAANGTHERKPSLAERCAELADKWGAMADDAPNSLAGESDSPAQQAARDVYRTCCDELLKVLNAKDAEK